MIREVWTEQHYHIVWMHSGIDWEPFATRQEAEERAREIKAPNEHFAVEEFQAPCERCEKMARSA